MNLKNQNILYFARTMQLGGTENVVIQLCEIFKPLVNKIIVCSCGGVNVEKLDLMGIKHYEIQDIEIKSPQTVLSTLFILLKIVRKENISIIHTHHRMAAFYVSLLGLYRKCVFINTSHNTFDNKKWLTRFAYKHGNLIACGIMVKKNLIDYFLLPSNQITVIHNAVRPFAGPIIKDDLMSSLRNQGSFIVGNVGRLSEQKGMEYFIKAIPEIVVKHSNVRFVIVGVGEDEQKLNNLVQKLKINEYVTFMGYRDDIQNLMSQMDIVVLCSLWEGLPLTPIEAFSVGKTIVATAVDGTVEIVRDGVEGCLIPPKSVHDIASKVNLLIENPKLRFEYETQSSERYQREFSFDKFTKEYINYYERLNRDGIQNAY